MLKACTYENNKHGLTLPLYLTLHCTCSYLFVKLTPNASGSHVMLHGYILRLSDIFVLLKLMHSLWSFLDCHRFVLPRWPCQRGGSCCLVTMPHVQADFPLAPFPKSGYLQKQGLYELFICSVCKQSNLCQGGLSDFKLNLFGRLLWLIAIY